MQSVLARCKFAFQDVWNMLKVLLDILYPRVMTMALPAPTSSSSFTGVYGRLVAPRRRGRGAGGGRRRQGGTVTDGGGGVMTSIEVGLYNLH